MVKLFTATHTFNHPFDRVTSAFWRKYPNDSAAHVKAIDVTERRVDAQGRLVTNRIMSCESAIPSWLRSAGLPQTCFVAESSVVDPGAQRMVVKSSNLSGASLLVVEETCSYAAAPAAPHAQTLYKQEARITAFLPFLASKFESYSVANLHAKSAEGIAVVEKLCQRIQHSADGVLSLLKWEQPHHATATSAAQ